jgi:phosphoglycerol transferase
LGPPIAESDDGRRAVYRVPPSGAAPVPREALLLPRFGAPITFTERPLPRGVSVVSGFSGVEPTGRWTEGRLARIEFEQPLPSRFALRVDTAMAMPPSADVDLPVRIGGVARTMRLRAGESTAEIEFDGVTAASAIDFVIPKPVSPRELGMGPDPRQLGFALRSLTVLPRDR